MKPGIRQRRERIVDEIFSKTDISVPELASLVGTSEATVRRDLHQLEGEDKITLSHGSVALKKISDFSFLAKAKRNVDAKKVIARLAVTLINDNDHIFLGSGSTCYELAPGLKRKAGLSVITNSSRLAVALDEPSISIILIGGRYRPDRMDMVGDLAQTALDQLRGYKALISVDGVSMEFGLSAADVEGAHLYRLAARNAKEVILPIDHTKFLAPSLCKIVEWDVVSTVITDTAPPPEWISFFQKRGIKLVYPEA